MIEQADNYDSRLEAAVAEVVATANSVKTHPGMLEFWRLVVNFAKAYDVRSTDVDEQAARDYYNED